jgi:hypothetical protein
VAKVRKKKQAESHSLYFLATKKTCSPACLKKAEIIVKTMDFTIKMVILHTVEIGIP